MVIEPGLTQSSRENLTTTNGLINFTSNIKTQHKDSDMVNRKKGECCKYKEQVKKTCKFISTKKIINFQQHNRVATKNLRKFSERLTKESIIKGGGLV